MATHFFIQSFTAACEWVAVEVAAVEYYRRLAVATIAEEELVLTPLRSLLKPLRLAEQEPRVVEQEPLEAEQKELHAWRSKP